MDIDFYEVPVYVITCEQDTERQAITQNRLEEQNIKFEWFFAADATKLTQEDFERENIFINYEKDKGSAGCALSHVKLWRKMVDENIERMLVFEDDIVFHENFKERLPMFWDATPKEKSMAYLGYCCYWGAMGQFYVIEHMPLTTHAYYITIDAARWFLENLGEVREHIDIHMQKLYYAKADTRAWKCYLWWEGVQRSPLHNQTRLGVCFNGLILQDHSLKNTITRELDA